MKPSNNYFVFAIIPKFQEIVDIDILHTDLEPNNIIFGFQTESPYMTALNHVFLLTKRFIYTSRCNNITDPAFENLVKFIRTKINLEKMSMSDEKFMNKWSHLSFFYSTS